MPSLPSTGTPTHPPGAYPPAHPFGTSFHPMQRLHFPSMPTPPRAVDLLVYQCRTSPAGAHATPPLFQHTHAAPSRPPTGVPILCNSREDPFHTYPHQHTNAAPSRLLTGEPIWFIYLAHATLALHQHTHTTPSSLPTGVLNWCNFRRGPSYPPSVHTSS